MSSFRLSSVISMLTGLSLLGAGCVPDLGTMKARAPHRQTPSHFADAGGATSGGEGQTTAVGSAKPTSVALRTWQDFFPDPELQALVSEALENNQELNINLQELIIAENEIMARKGEYLPKVNAGVGAGVDKVGKYTSRGASDEATGVPEIMQDYRFGFSASWELDIWKKLRNAAKSATLRYLATVEGRRFMVTRLVAEIARSYYELMAVDRQLEVLKANIEIQQNALEVVRLEKQAARTTELAVQRFEAEVLKNQSRQFELEQARVQTQNRLNFLVGRFPQAIPRDPQRLDTPLPEVVHVGLPSQLLQNRPDIRQAEFELEASKLDVEVARAQFFPSLSIEANIGYEAFNLKHLVTTPESTFFGLGGNLLMPLLNRRAIKAQYFSANAQQLQAVYRFEQTILKAFTEVANQLAMIANLERSYELESQQVSLLNDAIEVSNVLFQSARADYMEVLLTRRDALESQMDLIDTRLRQRQALVNVYQALGGGWRQRQK